MLDKKLMQEAKELFAARHNKTWQDIKHEFEIGGGISKVMDEFAVMESVAEIYAEKKHMAFPLRDDEIAQGALDYLKEVGSVDKKDIIFHDFQKGAMWYRAQMERLSR